MDREERLVFVRRLPANRPFTGGFSFRLKKIKTAIDFSRRFAIITSAISPQKGKPRQMRVDRGGTQGFQGRPPTKPLVTTGGFSFRFKKIKIAIDFSRRFAIIILPSPGNGKPRQMRVDRGACHGFPRRPRPKALVITGGFPLLRDVTLLCYGAVKSFGFSGFPCRGRKLPFSLISGAETRKIPGA